VKINKKVPEHKFWNFSYLLIILVDLPSENWNCIFEDLVVLCERLEELGIEAIMEAED
jgi:hypothetical protein